MKITRKTININNVLWPNLVILAKKNHLEKITFQEMQETKKDKSTFIIAYTLLAMLKIMLVIHLNHISIIHLKCMNVEMLKYTLINTHERPLNGEFWCQEPFLMGKRLVHAWIRGRRRRKKEEEIKTQNGRHFIDNGPLF